MKHGEPIDRIYLDFAKSFDKVPLRRLLGHFGVKGNLLLLVKSFLSDRQFSVKVSDNQSSFFHVRDDTFLVLSYF